MGGEEKEMNSEISAILEEWRIHRVGSGELQARHDRLIEALETCFVRMDPGEHVARDQTFAEILAILKGETKQQQS